MACMPLRSLVFNNKHQDMPPLRFLHIIAFCVSAMTLRCGVAQEGRTFECHSTVHEDRMCRGALCLSEWRVSGQLGNGTCLRQDWCYTRDSGIDITQSFTVYQVGVKFSSGLKTDPNNTDVMAIAKCGGHDNCTDKFNSSVLFSIDDCRYADSQWQPINSTKKDDMHRRSNGFRLLTILGFFSDVLGHHGYFNCKHKKYCSLERYKKEIQLAGERSQHHIKVRNVTRPPTEVRRKSKPASGAKIFQKPIFAAICYAVALTTILCAVVYYCGKLRYSKSLEAAAVAAAEIQPQTPCLGKPSLKFLGNGSALKERVQVGESSLVGAFSTTFHCTWQPADRQRAEEAAMVKFYDGGLLHAKYWVNECLLYDLFQLKNVGLLQFLEGGIQQNTMNRSVWIVCEQSAKRSLRDFLIHNGKQLITKAVSLLVDAAGGLAYLHNEGERRTASSVGTLPKPCIAHCHLNPTNVFVRANGSACIGDLCCSVVHIHKAFGLTRHSMQDLLRPSTFNFVPVCGSPRYASPEMLNGWVDAYDNFDVLQASDIYSLSLIMWEVLILSPVVAEGSMVSYTQAYSHIAKPGPGMQQMHDITVKQQRRPFLPSSWDSSKVHRDVKAVMEDCWRPQSHRRPKASLVHRRLHGILLEHYGRQGGPGHAAKTQTTVNPLSTLGVIAEEPLAFTESQF